MNNTGNKLTQDILKQFGFKKHITRERGGDECKWWIKEGISIHEDSWWFTETDENGVLLEHPVSSCAGEEPEITFAFATYVRGDGGYKGGWLIKTDQQLKNLYFSLTNKHL